MLVVGGGQSALDAARLLYAHGAMPELVAKQKAAMKVAEFLLKHPKVGILRVVILRDGLVTFHGKILVSLQLKLE